MLSANIDHWNSKSVRCGQAAVNNRIFLVSIFIRDFRNEKGFQAEMFFLSLVMVPKEWKVWTQESFLIK